MQRLTYTSGTTAEHDAAFEAALRAARDHDAAPLPHLIGGHADAAGAAFERRDPSDVARVAARAHAAPVEAVARAVAAARAAAPAWRRTPPAERCARLRRVAAELERRAVEIAGVVSAETGKVRGEAVAEVLESADIVSTYAGFMEERDGYVLPLGRVNEDERNVSVLRPYGVFGVVGPFNFPVALNLGMTSAALLGGNAVVLKPSALAPRSAALLAEVLEAAELPPGTFNLVHGDHGTGAALVASAVDGIAFTGSAEVGRGIARAMAAGPHLRPALMEMGGKNPAIVTASADLERAALGVARSAFGFSGQKCSACSRAIVDARVHDAFAEALVAVAGELAVGHPLEAGSFTGPVVSDVSARRYDEAVAHARAHGRVLTGGRRLDGSGHFVAPTVVADLPTDDRLLCDELFVPLVALTRAEGLGDALVQANDTDYGLSAGIFTAEEAEAEAFLDRIDAGVVYVNHDTGATTGAWPGAQSFCGWKASGSTGKGGLGAYYVQQFMREQSRTVVG